MPEVWKGARRFDILSLLEGNNNIGIELGVAAGQFSGAATSCGKFERFIGVDMYADHHDIREYKHNLRNGYNPLTRNNIILRMRFDEALDLFPNHSFDFIYIDGYAHTGEEGGKTFYDWWPKLKPGGLFAGDDYHEKWPLVIKYVDQFMHHHRLNFQITEVVETQGQGKFPTWFTRKPEEFITV